MTNLVVLDWYLDQVVTYFGIIISIILYIIIIKKLHYSSSTLPDNTKYPLSLTLSIHLVYITCIILYISGIARVITLISVKQAINQHTTCNIIYGFGSISFAIFEISIINFFIQRLHLSFGNTVFMILFIIVWIIILIFLFIVMDVVPYNIYSEEIDFNGNGVICIHGEEISLELSAVLVSMGLTVLIGNIIVWIIFMKKLTKLIKQINKNTHIFSLINLMKEQTMIVSIAALSTVAFWGLGSVFDNGQFIVQMDFIVNIFVIFLSFKFNRYYFKLFKCDKLTQTCCKYLYGNHSINKHEETTTESIVLHNTSDTHTIATASMVVNNSDFNMTVTSITNNTDKDNDNNDHDNDSEYDSQRTTTSDLERDYQKTKMVMRRMP